MPRNKGSTLYGLLKNLKTIFLLFLLKKLFFTKIDGIVFKEYKIVHCIND